MKKSKAVSFVFAIASVALISWTVFVVAAENGFFTSKGTSWPPSNCPSLAALTKTNGFYNISLSFSAENYSRQLQNILINPSSNGTVAGLTGYINGTVVKGANPVFSYCLRSGDSLQVSVMFPCEDFSPGTLVDIAVMGDCFMTGGTVLLP